MKKVSLTLVSQFKLAFILISALCVLSLSCKKEGPAGPQGLEGPAGPTGAQGSQGTTGSQGAQGNANVMSGIDTLTNADYASDYWTLPTGGSSSLGLGAKRASIAVASITTNIFNTGTVLVYLKMPVGFTSNLTAWSLLPFSLKSFDGNYFISLKTNYEIGKVNIYYLYEQTNSSATLPLIFTATVPDYIFKYIVIAGSTGARKMKPSVDFNDYAAVCRYYGIPQ